MWSVAIFAQAILAQDPKQLVPLSRKRLFEFRALRVSEAMGPFEVPGSMWQDKSLEQRPEQSERGLSGFYVRAVSYALDRECFVAVSRQSVRSLFLTFCHTIDIDVWESFMILKFDSDPVAAESTSGAHRRIQDTLSQGLLIGSDISLVAATANYVPKVSTSCEEAAICATHS